MRHFEDFMPGEARTFGRFALSAEEIIAFAREFDPQPMHLDGNSAQARETGGLIASGWHTAARTMREMVDGFLGDTAGLGAPGVDQLKWLRPVRPGDTLTCHYTVTGKRQSRTKPDRGFVQFTLQVANQHGDLVLEQHNPVMIATRNAEPLTAPEATAQGARPPAEEFPLPQDQGEDPGVPVEKLTPGIIMTFATREFPLSDTLRFAEAFDPQRFHLDEDFAKTTHFGGLSASGWHTAAGWMRAVTEFWKARQARGAYVPRLGTSPGFRGLQWIRPVMAGDSLTYYGRILEVRKSASRPGWGLVTTRNFARNQHGTPVFAFTGTVFWGMET